MVSFSYTSYWWLIVIAWLITIAFQITRLYEARFELYSSMLIRENSYDPLDLVWKTLRKSFESFRYIRQPPPKEYEVFISYRSSPADSKQFAYLLSLSLQYRSKRKIHIITRNLDDEPLVKSMGHDAGLVTLIKDPASKSSVFILVYTDDAFYSYWVMEEVRSAMRAADLILILNLKGIQFQNTETNLLIKNMNSPLNKLTMKAPTYIKDIYIYTDNSIIDLTQELEKIFDSKFEVNKFYFDVLSILFNALLNITFLFYGLFSPFRLNAFVYVTIVVIYSFLSSILFACRSTYSKIALKELDFKKVYTGWRIDMYRLEKIVFQSLTGVLLSFFLYKAWYIKLIVFTLISTSNLVLIHDILQMLSLKLSAYRTNIYNNSK